MKKNIWVLLVIVLAFLAFSCKNVNTNADSNSNQSVDSTFVTDSKIVASNWELYNIEDEFGDKTPEKYLGAKGKGSASLDANRDIDVTVYLFIRHDEIFFKFHLNDLQYTSHDNLPITMKIKDGDGIVYSFDLICKNNGEISMRTDKDYKQSQHQFISLLEKGGLLSGATQILGTPYKFKIDVSGYTDAIKRL
jgi:hypothetical protein